MQDRVRRVCGEIAADAEARGKEANRQAIENEVVPAMIEILRSGKGCSDMTVAALKIYRAIEAGDIPHVRIDY